MSGPVSQFPEEYKLVSIPVQYLSNANYNAGVSPSGFLFVLLFVF